jgi:enoyl-CoA hydratase/carnithine racemase
MAYETLLLAREESFAVITLNRPPMNAINEALMRDLNAALSELQPDDAVRSIIITGAGDRIFCAGADLGSAFTGDIAAVRRFRILRESARMGQTESSLGIIPGYGGTQRLPRLIGRGLALEHLILGSQISAQECYRIGLVNRLAKDGETLADAKALARELGKRPPIATRVLIEAVDDGLEAPIDKAIEVEIRAFDKVIRTEDAAEGLQAFFQKRPAEFKGK